ncbi:MAG: zinc ribbon domain-containing protein [Pirellulaceae bacterium]
MNISAESLRELHRIHRQLKDLRDRLDRGPKQVAAAEANVKKMEAELEQAKDAARKTRITADQKQLQLKSREDKIKDLQAKLNQAASNREYQAFKEQIAADEQANSVLSDEILEALEKMDVLAVAVKTAEANLKKSREEGGKIKQRVDDERGMLESELARVQANLVASESKLPAEFKQEYDRIARARGEDALAQIEGEVCGHCYQKVTAQTMNELYLSRPVFCKSCGCLLYLSEDRTPRNR